MVVSDHYLKKYSYNPIQTWCIHLLGECSGIICFLAMLARFWPYIGHKITENGGFLPLSEKCNPLQTWCVHLFGECSELISFLATLAKFWPSSGHKITENGGFRPLSEKVFMQSYSNLVCTLIGWVFRIDSLLGHVGQILTLEWPQNDWKWWFLTNILKSTIMWNNDYSIYFKHGVYTGKRGLQK